MTARDQRELEREHQARTLKTRSESEPRLSRADESRITRSVRQATDVERRDVLRAELDHLLATLSAVEHLLDAYGRIVPGDHRSVVRLVDFHGRRLRAALSDLAEKL